MSADMDLLERATRALRGTSRARPADLERVLERLEQSKGPQRARGVAQRYLRSAAWALAATLLGVGALANATGRVRWFEPEPASAPPAAPAASETSPERRRAARVARAPSEAVPDEPPAAVEPLPPTDPPATPSVVPALAPPLPEQPDPAVKRREPRAAPVAKPPASESLRDDDPQPDADALYREAHAAHFRRRDDAAALVAWDRYLAVAEPGHRWRLEARYNRGIALFRLGRTREARRALEPFAQGEYGSYRRAEAQRILSASSASE